MIDRRVFIAGSAACAGALAVWPGAAGASSSAAAEVTLTIVDRKLAGSESFAAHAKTRGELVREFLGDAGSLWMNEIEPRLRAGPVALAGYTSAPTWFCLDLLARDYGARTLRRDQDGAAVTWVVSSQPLRRAALAPIAKKRGSHA